MRYALRYSGPKAIVHFTADDEARNSFCGVSCSVDLRYSRRDVAAIRARRNCERCVTVLAARKRRAARA